MRGDPVLFQGFVDGVNLIDPPYSLTDRQARDARNVIAASRGGVRKRNGNVAMPITGLTTHVQSLFAGTNPELLIAQDGTNLVTISSSGTRTVLATGLSATARWEWVAAPANTSAGTQGPYYGVNGVDAPRFVTSTTTGGLWTTSGGAAIPVAGSNAKYIKYFSNRVILAGDPAFPSRVYASKILDPRVFAAPDGWAVDFDASDGMPITGLATVGPYLLVFKEHKTWVIYDPDTGANRRISDGIGCISHRSAVETPRGTMFLARDGLYRTNGQTVDLISERVQPVLDAMVAANVSAAAGAFFMDHYYLSVSSTFGGVSAASNNIVLDYDLTLDCWWLHTTPVTQFAVWRQSTGTNLLGARAPNQTNYAGAAVAAGIDTFFVNGVNTDAGTPFNSYWSGPFHTFGTPYIRKRLRRLHFDGKGLIKVLLANDFATTGTQIASLDFGGSSSSSDTFGGTGSFGQGTTNFGGITAGTLAKSIDERIAFTPASSSGVSVGSVARAFGLTFANDTDSSFEVESYTLSITPRRN